MMEEKVRAYPLQPLERISPSRYVALTKCNLREIWALSKQGPLIPVSPQARLGSLIHRMLEIYYTGAIASEQDFYTRWDTELASVEASMAGNHFEKRFLPLEEHTRGFEVKKLMVLQLVKGLLRQRTGQSSVTGRNYEAEKWIATKDNLLGGRVDCIRVYGEDIEISDLKTGDLFEEDGKTVKEGYQTQLKLYAGMYHECEGKWPAKIQVAGLDGKEHSIPFSQEECENLLDEAKTLMSYINGRITAGDEARQFAAPSGETCRFCQYRPVCSEYWNVRDEGEGWPVDVKGRVTERRRLGNGTDQVVIDQEGKLSTVRGLHSERHKFLNEDLPEVVICNLGKDVIDGFFVEKPMTIGYKL